MARALAVLSLVVALCANTVVADPDADVVIEDLKQITALAQNFTTQVNAIPGIPRLFNSPPGQLILDSTNALVRRFVNANLYLSEDNPGTFAKESETAVLQAYTAYVQAQKGFINASIEKGNVFTVILFKARISRAFENLYRITEGYGSSLEKATAGQASEVEDQVIASQIDLEKAINHFHNLA